MCTVTQLIFVRERAAYTKHGYLEDAHGALGTYKEYVRPIDRTISAVVRTQCSAVYPLVNTMASQFVSQQLFAHVLAQRYAPLCTLRNHC